ncbi:MAG: hypothetical protein AAB257_07300, partial [Nitrospinota bacterium]
MDKKRKVLIVSDGLNETSISLQRALNSLFYNQYDLQIISYSKVLLEIQRQISDAFRELPQEFKKKAEELQTSLNNRLEQSKKTKINEELERLTEDICSQLQEQIDLIGREINRLGEIMAGAYKKSEGNIRMPEIIENFNLLVIKKQNLENEKKAIENNRLNNLEGIEDRLKRQNAMRLMEFYKKYVSIVKEMENLILQIPEGAHIVLLEEYWQEMIEERSKRYLELSQTTSQNSYLWECKSFIDSAQKAVEKLLKDVSLIIILDFEVNSDYIYFVRRYWAEIIKYKNNPPPVIFISLNRLQDLIEKDRRYFVLLAKGVEFVTIPFSLIDVMSMIQKNANKSLSAQTLKEYIKQSCDLTSEGILQHAWRNFTAPYSLLKGAYYVDNIDSASYRGVLKKLQERDKNAWEEIEIYDAIAVGITDTGDETLSEQTHKLSVERPLSEILRGKKVLLIDDEAKKAGWEETIKVLFGNDIVEAIGKEWQSGDDLLNDSRINEATRRLTDYDLILLDLYLTKEDEEIKKKYPHGKPLHKEFSGISLLREIRKRDIAVPVILFTATTRHFNIKDAEKIKGGIDGYFQKESKYQSENEAVAYYTEFKNLIENTTCQERKALRKIWMGIDTFNR